MSLPVYVVNFDELISGITVAGVTVEVDTAGIESVLEQYFPQLIELLENLPEPGGGTAGTAKIKGFTTTANTPVSYTPESAIALTGVTFSQNNFGGSSSCSWTLAVKNGEAAITLLDSVYAKDALQQKIFDTPYPVPAGFEVVMTPSGDGGEGTVFWFDLEYLEVAG